MSQFDVQNNAVVMIGDHPPVRLSDWQCDQLLDLFEETGAVELFNRLYAAQRRAMGDLFISRVTSFRGPVLVVDNAPDVEGALFTQSMEHTL